MIPSGLINCASGHASNKADDFHAFIRAEHAGVAMYTQEQFDQIEMEWEAWAEGERNEDATTITNLEAELAISNAFGNWPWIAS